MKHLAAGLLTLLLASPGLAQSKGVSVYRVQIFTQYGERFRGILYDVSDSVVYFRDVAAPGSLEPRGGAVLLREIEKVVIKKDSRRAATLQGALIGGIGFGYLSVRSLQSSPFRSPVLGGLTVTLGVGAGAGFGALVGSLVGRVPRRVVRVRPGEPADRLGALLRLFAYRNQAEAVYGVP